MKVALYKELMEKKEKVGGKRLGLQALQRSQTKEVQQNNKNLLTLTEEGNMRTRSYSHLKVVLLCLLGILARLLILSEELL